MGTEPTKLLTLQAARAVAANLVVLQHLNQFETRYAGGPIPFAQYGDFGVDLFFVLSGFVMVAVAGRNVGSLQFLWRRATRIYPTYWLATLVTLGIALAIPGLVHKLIGSISMWHSFLLVPDTVAPVVGAGWTLIHEMYFYVVFAAILALRAPPLAAVIVWGVLILGATIIWPPDYIIPSSILEVVTSPLTFEFILGVIVGTLWLRRRTAHPYITGFVGIVALLGAIPIHYYLIAKMGPIGESPNYTIWRVVLFGLPMALILYALVGYERQATSRPPPQLLVSIGDWSYSIYLFHFMALSAIARAVLFAFPDRGALASSILFIAGFVACNAIGAALYFLFERPTLQLFRKKYFSRVSLQPLRDTASGSASLRTQSN